MASRLKTLHISDPTVWFDVKHDLSPSHWQNLRKLHFAVGHITEELDTENWIKAPALEWLSIDGWDRNYSRDGQVQRVRPNPPKCYILFDLIPTDQPSHRC